MPEIVVETGVGTLASANSFFSLNSCTQYFTNIGKLTNWASGTTTTQSAALIRATYLMENYDWIGTKALSTQPLEWPRRNVTDKNNFYISSTVIPLQIKWIQAELAYRFLNGDDPLPDNDTTGNVIREKVDVVEIQYDSGGAQQVPSQPYIDTLLREWVRGKSSIIIQRA
jgi:hypothetical protein